MLTFLDEMDLDKTSELVEDELARIVNEFNDRKIDETEALSQLRELLTGIETQLSLSDLTKTEKAEFKDIKLLIRIAMSEIKEAGANPGQ